MYLGYKQTERSSNAVAPRSLVNALACFLASSLASLLPLARMACMLPFFLIFALSLYYSLNACAPLPLTSSF